MQELYKQFLAWVVQFKLIIVVFVIGTVVASGALLASNNPAFMSQPGNTLVKFSPNLDFALEIKPEFNIDTEVLECLETRAPLKAKITKPKADANFAQGKAINIAAEFNFACFPLKQKQVQVGWILDGNPLSAKTLASQIFELTPGTHELTVDMKYQRFTASNSVRFNVNKVVNLAPVVQILNPKDGAIIAATDYDRFKNRVAKITAKGAASDQEDGKLSGRSLRWELIYDGKIVQSGSGEQFYFEAASAGCSPAQYQLRLSGTDSGGQKTIQLIKFAISDYCLY